MPRLREGFEAMVQSGGFVLGPVVEKFERDLAAYCGVAHAVGMSSGTDALLAALMAFGIGAGDEVITSPFTFFATVGSIARVGARPVFVDIDPTTFNLDAALVARAVTSRTKSIMPVHLFGQTADMTPIMDLARRRNIVVIEDAAQAIGAEDTARRAGSIGDVGCLSFYPSKNLSCMGDGGGCTTNDTDLAERLRVLRNHGQKPTYHHGMIGGNFRLDAFQAMVLGVKLPHLEGWTADRRRHAERYRQRLSRLSLTLPTESPGKRHVYNQFTVRVPGGRRDALREHLTQSGIGSQVYYPKPMHLQPCFAELGYKRGDFPVAEATAEQVVSLPIFPEMTADQQDEVIAALERFFA